MSCFRCFLSFKVLRTPFVFLLLSLFLFFSPLNHHRTSCRKPSRIRSTEKEVVFVKGKAATVESGRSGPDLPGQAGQGESVGHGFGFRSLALSPKEIAFRAAEDNRTIVTSFARNFISHWRVEFIPAAHLQTYNSFSTNTTSKIPSAFCLTRRRTPFKVRKFYTPYPHIPRCAGVIRG